MGNKTQPFSSKSDKREDETSPANQSTANSNSGSSDEKGACLYHQIVCLPFRIREFGGKDRCAESSPLDRWIKQIKDRVKAWSEYEECMPFNLPEMAVDEDGRSKKGTYARLRYAEYAYFHPFVRAFLYPTVEDRFHSRRKDGVSQAKSDTVCKTPVVNRSLRTLKRDDIRWARIFVNDRSENSEQKVDEDAGSGLKQKVYVLRVRRVEIHLFETRIGFLSIEFDNEMGPHKPESPWDHEYDSQNPDKTLASRPFDIARGTTSDWGDPPAMPPEGWESPNQLKLDDVLLLQDALRRSYVPYWEFDPVRLRGNVKNHLNCSAGHVVQAIEWYDGKGKLADLTNDTTTSNEPANPENSLPEVPAWPDVFQQRIKKTCDTGVPPMMPWWTNLMQGLDHLDGLSPSGCNGLSTEESWLKEILAPDGKPDPNESYRVCYREFGDDRLPCMTFVGTKEPWKISKGDWMRLAFADEPGDSNRIPYSPWLYSEDRERFNEAANDAYSRFCRRFALDRFFAKISSSNESTLPTEQLPLQQDLSTRYLASGMVFAAVGCSDPAAGRDVKFNEKELPSGGFRAKPFGIDPVNGLLGHFRYHYFKLGLVALFHRFSLLNFEEELSIAVSEELGKSGTQPDVADGNFRRLVTRVRKELIKFRLRFWFSEVTAQEQGQEIFSLWSEHLRTRQLFEGVNQQVDEAEELLQRWDAKARQEEAERRAEAERQEVKARQAEAKRREKAEKEKNRYLFAFSVIGIPLAFFGVYKDLLPTNMIGWAVLPAILSAFFLFYACKCKSSWSRVFVGLGFLTFIAVLFHPFWLPKLQSLLSKSSGPNQEIKADSKDSSPIAISVGSNLGPLNPTPPNATAINTDEGSSPQSNTAIGEPVPATTVDSSSETTDTQKSDKENTPPSAVDPSSPSSSGTPDASPTSPPNSEPIDPQPKLNDDNSGK